MTAFLPRHRGTPRKPPVWTVVLLEAAMAVRILAGFPMVPAPHSHGARAHAHWAGGLPHTHGDGVFLVYARSGAGVNGDPDNARAFPVRVPVRRPPSTAKGFERPASRPGAPEPVTGETLFGYFCGAGTLSELPAPPLELLRLRLYKRVTCAVCRFVRERAQAPHGPRGPPALGQGTW